jgi:hypothetical protein
MSRGVNYGTKQIRDSLLQFNKHSVGEKSGQNCGQHEQGVRYGTRQNRERSYSAIIAIGMNRVIKSRQRCGQHEQGVRYGTRQNRDRGQSASIAIGQSRGVNYSNARSRSESVSYSSTSIAWVKGRAKDAVSMSKG